MDKKERLEKWKKARQARQSAFRIRPSVKRRGVLLGGSTESSRRSFLDDTAVSNKVDASTSDFPVSTKTSYDKVGEKPTLSLNDFLNAHDGRDSVDSIPNNGMYEDDSDAEELNNGSNLEEHHSNHKLLKIDSKINIDHSKFKYPPFRSAMYNQLPMLNMTFEELQGLRKKLGIQQADTTLTPVQEWYEAGLPATLMAAMAKFPRPTAIQAQALPVIMSGFDVVAVAPTGSGKTISYLVPAVRHALENSEMPSVVIVAPTRELAKQIGSELEKLISGTALTHAVAAGGTDIALQIARIRKGSNIIVGTPGRLIGLLAAGRLSLQKTSLVILDETDRMFDMGFEPQISRIIAGIRPDHQTVLFSATMSPRMQRTATKFLSGDAVSLVIGTHSSVPPHVEQRVDIVIPESKYLHLLDLLGTHLKEYARALVFVEKQETAGKLAAQLKNRGFRAAALHAGLLQSERTAAIQNFKDEAVNVLVATSVAARGLDIASLRLVVNYDPPSHVEDYVHRAGRTGRAGLSGTAVTFLTPQQPKAAHIISEALTMSSQPTPKEVKDICDGNPDERNSFGYSGFGGHGIDRLDLQRARRIAGEEDKEPSLISEGTRAFSVPEPVIETKKGKHVCEIIINNFPREARQAVTAPSVEEDVAERHRVALFGRGVYGDTTDKLRIEIEGTSRDAVIAAYGDLAAIIEDAAENRQTSKYSI